VLALSGVEAIANLTGVMKPPVFKTARKAIYLVAIEVAVFNLLLAAAMIAVLLMGATAYALVPSVRRAVDDAVHVFIGDADPPLRQTDPASDADEPPANTPGEQPAPSPGTGEAPGDDETGQDANGDSDPGSGNDGTNGDGAGSGSNDGETGGEQGSSGDEGSAEGGSGTGSEADGEDHGSSGDEGASMDSGMGSGE